MPQRTLDKEIEKVLIDLKYLTPDVEGAVLVDMNGLPIASVLSDGIDDDRVSAMSAAMLIIGERTMEELSKGRLVRVLIQGEKGYSIIFNAGKDAVLSVLTNEQAKLGMIFFDANLAAVKIGKILSERG